MLGVVHVPLKHALKWGGNAGLVMNTTAIHISHAEAAHLAKHAKTINVFIQDKPVPKHAQGIIIIGALPIPIPTLNAIQ